MAAWNRPRPDLMDEKLERQNDLQAQSLAQKVSTLKNLAFDIETETKEHNHLLNSVDSEFDSSTGFLAGSSNRVHQLLGRGRGDRRVMCYVSGALVFVFCICYYLVFIRTAR